MPKINSGRQFVLSFSPLKKSLTSGNTGQMLELIARYRLSVKSASDLLPLATVGYFDPAGQGPPAGATYSAGFTAGDVLTGRTDWSADEVEEFRAWSASDRVARWLADELADVDEAIRKHSVWPLEGLLD